MPRFTSGLAGAGAAAAGAGGFAGGSGAVGGGAAGVGGAPRVGGLAGEELARALLAKACEMGDESMSIHTARLLASLQTPAWARESAELGERLIAIAEQLESSAYFSAQNTPSK